MAEAQRPDRWQSFVEKMPEQYRADPDTFLAAYEQTQHDLEAARREATDAATYKTWYTTEYQPKQASLQAALDRLADLEKREGSAHPSPRGTPTTAAPPIDWDDDPSAAQKAFTALQAQLTEERQQREAGMASMGQEFVQGRDTLTGLIGILEEARRLEREMPDIDMTRVAEYAANHGIKDLKLAANEVYRDRTIDTRVKEEVAKARKQWEQEQQTRQIHTEHGPGVPPRAPTFRNQPTEKGYGPRGLDGLYAAIAEKTPNLPW